jgi:nucleotide-binding universal stress UspA family protein
VDRAFAIGRWYEAAVILLHVCGPELDARSRESLRASGERLATSAQGTAVEVHIAEGLIPAQILAFATDLPADLLVMGSHGRSGLGRFVLGSVAETVLRKAGCPVLTVPAGAAAAAAAVFKRILCATDFSQASLRGLDYAMALAQEADASLTVLHVVESTLVVPPHARATLLANASTMRQSVAATEDDRLARLNACVPDDVRRYCSVETRLATGDPAAQILRTAAEAATDLIVIGIHGRNAAAVWYFGSTAQDVVRGAGCPVLTLRQS